MMKRSKVQGLGGGSVEFAPRNSLKKKDEER
jgi:hypothetical protein